MKGAEFYERGRTHRCREKKAVKKRVQGSLGWIWRRKREGRARKGGAKYEKGQNEKGVYTVESTDTRETRNHLPTAPWPYAPYFSPLFNPGTIFVMVGEKRKGNHVVESELQFCFFDREPRPKLGLERISRDSRILNSHSGKNGNVCFQLQKTRLQYFKFDINFANETLNFKL